MNFKKVNHKIATKFLIGFFLVLGAMNSCTANVKADNTLERMRTALGAVLDREPVPSEAEQLEAIRGIDLITSYEQERVDVTLAINFLIADYNRFFPRDPIAHIEPNEDLNIVFRALRTIDRNFSDANLNLVCDRLSNDINSTIDNLIIIMDNLHLSVPSEARRKGADERGLAGVRRAFRRAGREAYSEDDDEPAPPMALAVPAPASRRPALAGPLAPYPQPMAAPAVPARRPALAGPLTPYPQPMAPAVPASKPDPSRWARVAEQEQHGQAAASVAPAVPAPKPDPSADEQGRRRQATPARRRDRFRRTRDTEEEYSD